MKKTLTTLAATSVLTLLTAGSLHAGPITSTVTSDCMTELPKEGLSWSDLTGEGFRFMVYHSLKAGCDPTTDNPTGGFHIEIFPSDGSYRIEGLTDYLLKGCGHIQFDAHGRSGFTADGLDPLNKIFSVFDTKRDCVVTPGEGLVPVTDLIRDRVSDEFSPINDPPKRANPPGGDNPPGDGPPNGPPNIVEPPVVVPDVTSTLVLLACAMLLLLTRRL